MEQNEHTASFLAENPDLTLEQLLSVETNVANGTTKKVDSLAFSCSSIAWDHDEGMWSVFRALAFADVRVDRVKDGQWNGAITIALAPGQFIKFRQNLDGQNYDAFSC